MEEKLLALVDFHHNRSLKLIDDGCLLTANERESLCRRYQTRVVEIIERIFENRPIAKDTHSLLVPLAVNMASVGLNGVDSSIVIAGFGDKELFPGYRLYDVSGIINGRVIASENRRSDITPEKGGSITPLAQADDMAAFLFGMRADLEALMAKSIERLMVRHLPECVRDRLGDDLNLTQPQKDQLFDGITELCKGAFEQSVAQFRTLMDEEHALPLSGVVSSLSEAEIAMMAETLVSLESFRRKISMTEETVGGPIDVLVITKCDGPIWIKRKRLANPELNDGTCTC